MMQDTHKQYRIIQKANQKNPNKQQQQKTNSHKKISQKEWSHAKILLYPGHISYLSLGIYISRKYCSRLQTMYCDIVG